MDLQQNSILECNCETTSVIDEEIAELKIFDTANTVSWIMILKQHETNLLPKNACGYDA